MANKFYQDSDGLWWLNNKVIVPSKEIGFRVDNPAAPTKITIEGISNYYKEGIFVDAVIADIQDESGTPYGDWPTFKAAVRDFFSRAGLQQAGINLNGVGTLTIADADTWVELNPIGADFQISANAKGFIRDVIESEVVHTGINGTNYIFTGSTDLKCSANTTIKFALVKNDDIGNPLAVSEHTFRSAQGVENFSINKDIELNNGDTLNLYAQSGAANTTLTIYLLNTSYIGDR